MTGSASWRLLRHNRPFRRLWLARVVSFLGDARGLVALIFYVADEVGTGTAVALLLLAGDVTPTLLSPLVDVVADRLERRWLLIICELGQALAIGTIVIAEPPLVPLLALVAIQSLVVNLFQTAARSAVPDLVADEDFERANALVGGGTYGLEALGPLLAAVLLPFFSPLGLLAIDAVTFLVSPLLLAGLPLMPSSVRSRQHESVSAAAHAGIRYIWRNRILRPVAIASWWWSLSTDSTTWCSSSSDEASSRPVTPRSACCTPRPVSASSSGSRYRLPSHTSPSH